MRPLSVCMVTPYYPPSVGGIERFVFRLSAKLRDRGVRVRVLTGTHFGQAGQGDGVFQLHTLFTVMGNPLIPSLPRVLVEEDCDLVHSHDEHAFTSNQVAHTKPKLGRPLVMHCHGSYTGGSPAWRLFVYTYMKTLGTYTLKRSDVVVALSPSEAKILRRFGAKNIRVIPNAVDPAEYDRRADPSLFRSHYSLGQRKLVLFVGRLTKVKGVHLIPKIARLLNSIRDDLVFAVVGEGPLKSRLESEVGLKGPKNVVFTGKISQRELSSAYAAADVVLVPSQSEGMPAVVLESLLFRKPVVATRLPTLTDYFEGVCRFVEEGDVVGYARAVDQMLKKPPLEGELEAAERMVIEKFNWGTVTEQILQTYKELLERPSQSSR